MVEYNVNLEGKTALVTGAAGFIGSNLVKRLFHDVKDIISSKCFLHGNIVERRLCFVKSGKTCEELMINIKLSS